MKTFKEYLKEGFDSKDAKYHESQLEKAKKSYLDSVNTIEDMIHEIVEASDYNIENTKNMVYKSLDAFNADFGRIVKHLENLIKKAQGK